MRCAAVKQPADQQDNSATETKAAHTAENVEGGDHFCTFPQDGQRLPAKIRAEHRMQQRYEL